MIIAHNLIAMNTSNQLKKTNNDKSKSSEKLSSGMRINKASDNSAGLAISEKMRAQIRGLEKAESNIQDGISLVQTAEGGLANIEAPTLQRLRELAIQASNGTLTDADREHVQKEVKQLKEGINEIANNTEFNGMKLLNIPGAQNVTSTITETITIPTTIAVQETVTVPEYTYEATSSIIDLSQATSITIFEHTSGINEATFTIDELKSGKIWYTPDCLQAGWGGAIEKYCFSVDLTNNTFTTTAYGRDNSDPNNREFPLNNITGVRVNGISGYDSTSIWGSNIVSVTGNPGDQVAGDSVTSILGDNLNDEPSFGFNESTNTGITINFEAKKVTGTTGNTKTITRTKTTTQLQTITQTKTKTIVSTAKDLTLQVGANSEDTFHVNLTDARTIALGIDDIDFSTREGAESAISKIDAAINKVSSERGKFGAYQNALEHVYNNVSNYGSNLTISESRIRDADMSKEMMELTKANILGQASQAMLTQANNQPQAVLELLK